MCRLGDGGGRWRGSYFKRGPPLPLFGYSDTPSYKSQSFRQGKHHEPQFSPEQVSPSLSPLTERHSSVGASVLRKRPLAVPTYVQ